VNTSQAMTGEIATHAYYSLDFSAVPPNLRPMPSLSSTLSHQNLHCSTSPSVILTTVAGTPGVPLPASPMRSSLPRPNIMIRPQSSHPSCHPLRRSRPGARAVSPMRGVLKRGQKGVVWWEEEEEEEEEGGERGTGLSLLPLLLASPLMCVGLGSPVAMKRVHAPCMASDVLTRPGKLPIAAMSCVTRAASSTWLALPPKSGRERAAKWYYFISQDLLFHPTPTNPHPRLSFFLSSLSLSLSLRFSRTRVLGW
jgi:hypothetical protein